MAITFTENIQVLVTKVDGEVKTRKIKASATRIDSEAGTSISKYDIAMIPNDDTTDAKMIDLVDSVWDKIKADIPDETAEQAAIKDYETKMHNRLLARSAE
jgi:hypothetical protein